MSALNVAHYTILIDRRRFFSELSRMSKLLIYKIIIGTRKLLGLSSVAFTGLVLSLGGCSSLSAPSSSADSAENLDIAPELSNFVSQGKLSLRPRGEAEFKGFTANYRWEQTDGGYDLELWGALGQGRTHITGDADRIKIVDLSLIHI